MKKKIILGTLVGGLLLLGVATSGNGDPSKQSNLQTSSALKPDKTSSLKAPTCDGSIVTTSCTVDGISYKTYIHHPAVAEKSHTETVTTYRQETSGYCTLCSDGTYSPSCATGRGACSHHGGVAQWNAPVTRNVPVTSTKTVIDQAAQDSYDEKVQE